MAQIKVALLPRRPGRRHGSSWRGGRRRDCIPWIGPATAILRWPVKNRWNTGRTPGGSGAGVSRGCWLGVGRVPVICRSFIYAVAQGNETCGFFPLEPILPLFGLARPGCVFRGSRRMGRSSPVRPALPDGPRGFMFLDAVIPLLR